MSNADTDSDATKINEHGVCVCVCVCANMSALVLNPDPDQKKGVMKTSVLMDINVDRRQSTSTEKSSVASTFKVYKIKNMYF